MLSMLLLWLMPQNLIYAILSKEAVMTAVEDSVVVHIGLWGAALVRKVIYMTLQSKE